MPTVDHYWQATRAQLDLAFEHEVPRFFRGQPAATLASIREALSGGKRLRACLVCLLNEALGGHPGAALSRALAVECVQAASLIHDDLVDGDTLRRHRAAAWTVEGPRRAVLLGDLVFATALQRMAELGAADAHALGEAIATMASGAYREPLGPADIGQDAATDRSALYPHLIYAKTGVLFGAAARLGSLAAGASEAVACLAFEYGARTGEAFQIADDLQDLLEHAHAPEQAPTPQQMALLAPAFWHFCGDLALTPAHAVQMRRHMRSGMLAAIQVRLGRAVEAAEQLPDGACRALLRAAPRDIVRAMADDVP